MAYFTPEFQKFFEDLTANNSKTWFDKNRKRFQQHVKVPFEKFIEEMLHRIAADDPTIDITAKEAIMRINRDIRFSQDKTLYKTHMSAIISPAGRKDKQIPGMYMRFDADHMHIYGGAHMLSPSGVQKIRRAIIEHAAEFNALLTDATFVKKYGDILGDKHKRLTEPFKSAAAEQPILYNKQFYYVAILPQDHLLDEALPETIMTYYAAGKPLNLFLRRALAA